MNNHKETVPHVNSSDSSLSAEQKIWFGGKSLLKAFAPTVLYLMLPGFFMAVGMNLFGGRTTEEVISGSGNFYYTLGIIATIFILHKRSLKRGSSLAEDVTLELDNLNRKKLLLLLITGFGFGFFFSALVTVIPFPEFLISDYNRASDNLTNGTDPFLALLSTSLLAPVTEELVFRGYMLNRLLAWFDEKKSILITSIVFALCHVSLIWIVYAFLMGVLLTKVSMEEDNIAYSIVLHIGFNLNVVPIWFINRIPEVSQVVFANHLLISLYGMIACMAAFYFYKRYRKETNRW